MTAPALTIRRLSATARPDGDPERVSRLLRGVAEHRLDRALAVAALPPGTWCLQRLDVPVRLDLTRPDPALEAAWATELVSALLHALASGSPEVVHYHRDLDAIADLICGAATGRTERAWAWIRIGLLGPSDPPPAREPGAAILAALRRRPQLALGAVTTAVGRIGLPPLHRVLGSTGWIAVAHIVVAAAGGDASELSLAATRAGPLSATSTSASSPSSVPSRDHLAATSAQGDADTTLARALLKTSRLAEAVRRSRLRPDRGTVEAWALLIVAEVDISVLRRRAARGVVAAVTATFTDVSGNECSSSHRHSRGDSQWAGLLFLLATAADAGIPDAVLDDPVFASRPLPWALQGVAACLGLPVADPAVAAFAGVDLGDPPLWETGWAATDEERHQIQAIADHWATVTTEALNERDRDPLEVVTALMRRRGRISYQPGWIEIELSVDQVDVAVRRAGLDLDPGWVPWLGVVVMFRYV